MVLSSLLGGILLLALSWKISQLFRAPSDRVLRSVTLCIVCAALSFPLGVKAGARYVDSLTGAGVAKLLQNVLLLLLVYFLQCVFLYSASDRRSGNRRARWELIPLGATICVAAVAVAVTSETERTHTYATANMREPGVALFYLAAGLYLVYGLAMAFLWTLHYIRVSNKPLRTGLRLVAGALAAMVLMGALREGLTVTRWACRIRAVGRDHGGEAPAGRRDPPVRRRDSLSGGGDAVGNRPSVVAPPANVPAADPVVDGVARGVPGRLAPPYADRNLAQRTARQRGPPPVLPACHRVP